MCFLELEVSQGPPPAQALSPHTSKAHSDHTAPYEAGRHTHEPCPPPQPLPLPPATAAPRSPARL